MKLAVFAVAATLAGSVFAAPSEKRNPNCKDVAFNVSGSAMNRVFPLDLPFNDTAALLTLLQADLFPRALVKGPQTIAGTYCAPNVVNAKNSKLQVMFPSLTSNRDSWSALGGTSVGFFPAYQEATYSYVYYMNNKGYPTLAMDRLGNGKSSHPDPILTVQTPYEAALYSDLATQIRAGKTGQLPRKFTDITYVGNSLGSEIGSYVARQYPAAYTTFVLTGFSKSVQPSLPGVALQNALPAALVMPARFGSLSPGYLTASIEAARTNSFFGSPAQVDFDPEIAHLFYTREDVVSVGQFLSAYIGPTTAPNFTGRVLVLTGEQDQAFCGPGSPVLGPASCGPLLQETGSLFPSADYNWKSVNRTGHAIQLFKSAQKTFGIADAFLSGAGFHGGPPA